jgi:hypothetical protein
VLLRPWRSDGADLKSVSRALDNYSNQLELEIALARPLLCSAINSGALLACSRAGAPPAASGTQMQLLGCRLLFVVCLFVSVCQCARAASLVVCHVVVHFAQQEFRCRPGCTRQGRPGGDDLKSEREGSGRDWRCNLSVGLI